MNSCTIAAMSLPTAQAAAAEYLRTPLAIRVRCESIMQAGLDGKLAHFGVDLSKLAATAAYVVEVTRAAYPTLAIPVHGRMNHFNVGGVNRVASVDKRLASLSLADRTRAWIDLIVVSVLLDAGAGDAWRFTDEDGKAYGRSEGLAVASLRGFERGLFSATPGAALRVDAAALIKMNAETLADAFAVTQSNPLTGLEGRAELLRSLGHAMVAAPSIFADARPGGLLDHVHAVAPDNRLPASQLLRALLIGLGPIWPGRLSLGGENLGDVWHHVAAGGSGPSAGMVPFHKLSQWLAYSLFAPLEGSGIRIEQPGALTGLPEYRNGGLFIDMEVLVPKHEAVLGQAHRPGDEVIVEWRALTVALLDRLADLVRDQLGLSPEQLPLARILEGGTWAAGRKLAAGKRPGGGSPIQLVSDGTVF